MGLRAVAVRLRIAGRRPASWMALAATAATVAWLSVRPGPSAPEGALAVAVAAGTLAAVAVLGSLPREGAIAWAAARAAWPLAGVAGAWIACGPRPWAALPAAATAASCAVAASATAVAARAGWLPAVASGAGLVPGLAAAAAALWSARHGGGLLAAAACAWVATAAGGAALLRAFEARAPVPRGPAGVAVPRAVMVSALVAMVVCLFLAPTLAWGYAALAAAWLVAAAVPAAALGPGATGAAGRRLLLEAGAGRGQRPAPAAARIVAGYAAVLVWPPVVAAALAGWTPAALGPLGIAAAVAALALGLGAAVGGALAAGCSRDTAFALALGACLVALGAVEALVPPDGDASERASGLMLSNPGDPARLSKPRREPRTCISPRGVASCPDPPSPASVRRSVPPRRCSSC